MDNLISQISQGLASYTGAMAQATNLPPDEAKQAVNAALVKQILNTATNENNTYDVMAIQPLLIGTVIVLNSRIKELEEEAKDLPSPLNEKLLEQATEYHTICCNLDKIVKSFKHSGGK